MVFRVDNFIRNAKALYYYQECLDKKIQKVEDSSRPNLWTLGKELYEISSKDTTEEFPLPPPERKSRLEHGALKNGELKNGELESLVSHIKRNLAEREQTQVTITSNIYHMVEGVKVARIYTLDGKRFREECVYDSIEEADEEEFPTAVSNLKSLVTPYSLELSGNIAIIKKAS